MDIRTVLRNLGQPRRPVQGGRGIVLFIVLFVAVILIWRTAGLVTDWFWFQEVGYERIFTVTLLAQFQVAALFGIAVFIGIGVLLSRDRRRIPWRTVAAGLGLQFALAALMLKTPLGVALFDFANRAFMKLLGYSTYGAKFMFGTLVDSQAIGAIMAFQVLPLIIFVSALMGLLVWLGVIRLVVRGFAWLMNRVMRASGAESLNVAASIFMGQTEAPLTIRPYLPEMTQSELMTVMTSGMAHISGGIMAAYILFGIEAKHLLTAVIMTAPGTLMMAKMFVPETESPKTMGTVKLDVPKTDEDIRFGRLLEQSGIDILQENLKYLVTKCQKLGHMLEVKKWVDPGR